MKGTMRTHPLDDRGSFAWVADPNEVMQRASCAVVTDSGVLVIDPVDHPDLDAHLMPLGPVSAVVRLLNRHNRDGQAVASRHGVQVVGPSGLNGLDGATAIPIPAMPGWEETALWFPATGLLVCMEAVGTASYFLAHRGDHLGFFRVWSDDSEGTNRLAQRQYVALILEQHHRFLRHFPCEITM